MYIPVCPLTEANIEYVSRQRDTFLQGVPGSDFPGGKGESEHFGRPLESFVQDNVDVDGRRAFGLSGWDESSKGLAPGQVSMLRKANKMLGF
jgi:hypothetical protein